MMEAGRRKAAVMIMAIASVSACAGGGTARGDRPGTLSAAEMEEIYLARVDSARTRFTEADVRFMTRMIHHHSQAIEMAQLVPERTSNAQIRTLAGRIINAQNDEIALMFAGPPAVFDDHRELLDSFAGSAPDFL